MFILLPGFLDNLDPTWNFITVTIVDKQSGKVEYQGEAKTCGSTRCLPMYGPTGWNWPMMALSSISRS